MRDIALLLLLIGLVPVILRRPWIGILVWFWVGLMFPHKLAFGFMQTFPLASVVGLATLGALLFAKDRRKLPMKREMVMMFVLLGHMTLTTIFAINPDGAWPQWEKVVKILLMTFIAPMLIYGQTRIVWLLLVITASISFYGFKGGIFTIVTGGGSMVLGPPGSFLSGNTYIGVALVMILPLVLASARVFHRQLVNWNWPVMNTFAKPIGNGLYAVFWLTAIATLATYSRGALLGFLAMAPFIFWRMQRKLLLVVGFVMLVVVVGVTVPERLLAKWQTIESYEENASAMQRIQSWGANLNMALESPIVGKGFSNMGAGYNWWIQYANFDGGWGIAYSPHSIHFQMLGHHGFVGLFYFLLLLAFSYLSLGKVMKVAGRTPSQTWLVEYAWAIRVSLIGFLVSGTFLDVAYFDLLYALIALTIVMRREMEETAQLGSPEAAQSGRRQQVPRQLQGVPRPGFSPR